MQPADHIASLNGLQAWFKVRGSGPTCIFPTPGWGASADLYFETLEPLERFFSVVYLDTRGSGRSARGLSDDEYRVEHFLSDINELRKLLGEASVWVMGHSLGGLLAQMFAVEYPTSCRGLVLLDSTSAIDDEARADADLRVSRRTDESWFAAAFAAMNRDDDITTDEEFKNHLASILPFYFHDVRKYDPTVFDNVSFAAEAYRMMAINSDAFARGALDRLGEVAVPAVIVTGDDDFICSSTQAMRIHMRLPSSKLVVVERAGHFPWLEQPDTFYPELADALRSVGAITEHPNAPTSVP